MQAHLTKDSIAFSGKVKDVRALLGRIALTYLALTLAEYIEMCNREVALEDELYGN